MKFKYQKYSFKNFRLLKSELAHIQIQYEICICKYVKKKKNNSASISSDGNFKKTVWGTKA